MKKILFIIALFFTVISSYAQTYTRTITNVMVISEVKQLGYEIFLPSETKVCIYENNRAYTTTVILMYNKKTIESVVYRNVYTEIRNGDIVMWNAKSNVLNDNELNVEFSIDKEGEYTSISEFITDSKIIFAASKIATKIICYDNNNNNRTATEYNLKNETIK